MMIICTMERRLFLTDNLIFIHGLISSGQGFKGEYFRRIFPNCLTPDFEKYHERIPMKTLLKKRMEQLNQILNKKEKWIIIGSSFGGLMATLYAIQNPEKIEKLILLAPFLLREELLPKNINPIEVPVKIYHGRNDKVIPIEENKNKAYLIFNNLMFNMVEDDHQLHNTVKSLKWLELI